MRLALLWTLGNLLVLSGAAIFFVVGQFDPRGIAGAAIMLIVFDALSVRWLARTSER